MKVLVILSVLLWAVVTINCENVLVMCPLISKSHATVVQGMASGLVEKGHNVTVVTFGKPRKTPPNVREILVYENFNLFEDFSAFEFRREGIKAMLRMNFSRWLDSCSQVYEHPEVQQVMTEKFDLVMFDASGTYCVLGIAHRVGAPIIPVVTYVASNAHVGFLGGFLPPSFVPDPISPYKGDMNFWQRTTNIGYSIGLHLQLNVFFRTGLEEAYQRYVPEAPGVYEIMGNASLMFINSHVSLDAPRPFLPDVIEAGGSHCRPGKPLPKDLDDFASGAKDGFIFFSLGSIVDPKDMPEETLKVLLSSFAKLKHRVLWKWPQEIKDLPPNVKLTTWAPQQDLLAHPKIKLFITHGGLLSIQETVYHGVPVLCLPVFGDQDTNAQRAEASGYAKVLEIMDLKEADFLSALQELLENPSYREKAQHLSKIFRDQPQSPKDRATFWAEYVMRHKGAVHLRSAGRKLNFFQYHSLDSIAFIVTILCLILWVLKIVIITTCRKLCSRSAKTTAARKKTN